MSTNSETTYILETFEIESVVGAKFDVGCFTANPRMLIDTGRGQSFFGVRHQ